MLHVLSFLILSARLVVAASWSVAIDDTYGDVATGAMPIYNPPSAWTQGQACISENEDCLVDLDPKQVSNGTWHYSVGSSDDAPPRTIDLNFEGNSISVYCIISQVDRVRIAVVNMTFELDGQPVDTFFHDPSGTKDGAGNYDIQYNVAVYQSNLITPGNHTLRISSIGGSSMYFDYALYTTESDFHNPTMSALPSASAPSGTPATYAQNASSAHPRLGVIVGAAAGGAVLLIAIGILAFILIRRRRRAGEDLLRHRNDSLSKGGCRVYGRHDSQSDRRSIMSMDSVTLENHRASTPYFPFKDPDPFSPTSPSRDRGDADKTSVDVLPTDSSSLRYFPALSSSVDQPAPRIVVTRGETHLVEPDNSMARFARQTMVEREAELMRRMREMEAALVAK
ncbi:hypothetical protein BD311DRAFT_653290 [Dichomitus squalens]|uniref:Uncharacterized protein n=1 Tax=Dichomitus squalens TaxID=114155 RepID=A0A4Q9N2D9_9APHY|nr:hypothetical protein BD311DRAFT_653290 [Dichomitus squalens]